MEWIIIAILAIGLYVQNIYFVRKTKELNDKIKFMDDQNELIRTAKLAEKEEKFANKEHCRY